MLTWSCLLKLCRHKYSSLVVWCWGLFNATVVSNTIVVWLKQCYYYRWSFREDRSTSLLQSEHETAAISVIDRLEAAISDWSKVILLIPSKNKISLPLRQIISSLLDFGQTPAQRVRAKNDRNIQVWGFSGTAHLTEDATVFWVYCGNCGD